MPQSISDFHRELIKNAEILFKLAFGFSATHPQLGYLTQFNSYGHTARRKDLRLTKKEEFAGAGFLEHVATYTLAAQIDVALGELYPKRFESGNLELRSIAWIARLIRNAFAHNPFAPKWLIDRNVKNERFVVRNIISLDTTGLQGKYVARSDYGGPLALLGFSHVVRTKLPRVRRVPTVP
jgi:hypothetical protein